MIGLYRTGGSRRRNLRGGAEVEPWSRGPSEGSLGLGSEGEVQVGVCTIPLWNRG